MIPIIPIVTLATTLFNGWMGKKKVEAEGKATIAKAKVS